MVSNRQQAINCTNNSTVKTMFDVPGYQPKGFDT